MPEGIVAIIPVKGNSERVVKKNTRKFHNTSLLELKINQTSLVKEFDEVLVSSEDEEILALAKSMGASIHKRNPYYSTSHVPMSEVYSHLASVARWDTIAWVNVTNPLTDHSTYRKAIEAYKNIPEGAHDSLISVHKVHDYLFYQGQPVNFKSYPWPRSQDLEGVCAINFAISILKREDLIRRGTLVGDKPFLFYTDPLLAKDIDYQEDFDLCELIYRKKCEEKHAVKSEIN